MYQRLTVFLDGEMCFEEDVTSIILNEFMKPRISFEISVSCCISISLSVSEP